MIGTTAVRLFATVCFGYMFISSQGAAKGPAPAEKVGEPGGGCPNHEAIDIGGGYIVSAAKCRNTHEAWLVVNHASTTPAQAPVIVDHLTVRALAASEIFSIGPYCYRNGKSIFWAAIYDWKGKKKISKSSGGIKEAWIPNVAKGRFEPASKALIASVDCFASDDE